MIGVGLLTNMDIFRADVLVGKSILVTGGGSGLGKEISKALAAKGAQVHICGRRANVLEEALVEIGHGAKAHICDIRDADSIDAMMDAIWAHGPLTGLINNAAANFISGNGITTGNDANDFLIYNKANGALYYDADGNGALASVQILSLTGIPDLKITSFFIGEA